MSIPAAWWWPPKRPRCSEQAEMPATRSKEGIERALPRPSSPSKEITTTGRHTRSARRDATIPITPACQPSPAMTTARSRAGSYSRTSASSASSVVRSSTSRRSRLFVSRVSASRSASSWSSVSRRRSASIGSPTRPAALMRGPSWKATAAESTGLP